MLRHAGKLFLVFALHRSGSSAAAGVLHYLGADMGQNEGLFENLDFVLINDEILWSCGGAWDSPPTQQSIAALQYPSDRIKEFLASQATDVWGLKDPRFLLTFDAWKPYLQPMKGITCVFVHRPFMSSVHSLAFRDGLGLEKAAEVLAPYLENFCRHRYSLESEGADIIDVSYNQLVEDALPYVTEVNRRLNLPERHNLDLVNEWVIKSLKRF